MHITAKMRAILLVVLLSACSAEEEREYRGLRWWDQEGGGGEQDMMGGGGSGMMGNGQGGGGRQGGGGNGRYMTTIHNLIDNRRHIERTVNLTDYGAETYTRSDRPQVSEWIQTHVAQMLELVENDEGMIRSWDPLFRALFEHSDDLLVVATNDDNGVRASLNGSTDCGISLAQKHAEVLSKFIERGRAELQREHSVPDECEE